MIGDRLDTDVVGGRRAGLRTILVLSGVTSRAEAEAASAAARRDAARPGERDGPALADVAADRRSPWNCFQCFAWALTLARVERRWPAAGHPRPRHARAASMAGATVTGSLILTNATDATRWAAPDGSATSPRFMNGSVSSDGEARRVRWHAAQAPGRGIQLRVRRVVEPSAPPGCCCTDSASAAACCSRSRDACCPSWPRWCPTCAATARATRRSDGYLPADYAADLVELIDAELVPPVPSSRPLARRAGRHAAGRLTAGARGVAGAARSAAGPGAAQHRGGVGVPAAARAGGRAGGVSAGAQPGRRRAAGQRAGARVPTGRRSRRSRRCSPRRARFRPCRWRRRRCSSRPTHGAAGCWATRRPRRPLQPSATRGWSRSRARRTRVHASHAAELVTAIRQFAGYST